MTLPRRLNYNPSTRRGAKARHSRKKLNSGSQQLPSVIQPVVALSSSQDAIKLCNANQRLINFEFNHEGKHTSIEHITSQMLLMLPKTLTANQPSVVEQLDDIKVKEKKKDHQIKALRMSHKNTLCKHKSFRIFDTALSQIELEEQAAIKNLLDNSKNPLAERQQDELIAVTNLKYAKQRLQLKTKYLSLCQRYVLKVDSKVVSYHDKSVVRKRDPFSMDASERRMKRWNTKRFQKRKNLPQQSRLILKAWIDDHIDAPHPTDSEKKALAEAARITIEQVSNWFVNARVRYVPKQLKVLRDM